MQNEEKSNDAELLSGQVERVVVRKDNNWAVLRVRVKDQEDLASIVGFCTAQPGQQITAVGKWISSAYGPQFSAQTITETKPTSPTGIVRYLSSGILPGVGPVMAKKIVQQFGKETLDVLNNEPERLNEISGVGQRKIEKITNAWQEQRAVSEIMLFLNEHCISPSLCRRIYKKYAAKAIHIISNEPYRLALEVSGIGFKSADKIAQQVGIVGTDPMRLKAGLVHTMQEATNSGHCGLQKLDLLQKACEILDVGLECLEEALGQALQKNDDGFSYLDLYDGTVYLASIARCEEFVASTLLEKARQRPLWDINAEKAIEQAQEALGFTLAKQQYEGIKMMLGNSVSVLTGGPGTGKTSTLNTLLYIFRKNKVPVHLVAPTGKAAQRASEVTGMDASTIHRLLGIKGPGSIAQEIEEGVLVIDESSMIDILLMNHIAKAIKKVSIILVGDVDQIPSVGPGQILSDIIESGAVPVTRLTEVFRQAQGSLIIRNAYKINSGQMPEKGGKEDDFFFLPTPIKDSNGTPLEPAQMGEIIMKTISDLVVQRLPKAYGFDPIKDIMVLSPMNITATGVASLNIELQSKLNPSPARFITRMGTRFGVGDKVIQTRNNYDLDIFNGDVGIILDIDEDDTKEVAVDFSGRLVLIPIDDVDSLRLAYAMTIHKSQGSQADAVVIPVTTQHYTMLQRNLFYTGVTRAKKLVVLVGQHRAMSIAVNNADAMKRITRLKKLLQFPT